MVHPSNEQSRIIIVDISLIHLKLIWATPIGILDYAIFCSGKDRNFGKKVIDWGFWGLDGRFDLENWPKFSNFSH